MALSPPTVDLLLCGHHYRASQAGLRERGGAGCREPATARDTCGYRCSAAVGMTLFDTRAVSRASPAAGVRPAGPQGAYCSLVITGVSIAGRGSGLSGTAVKTFVSGRLAAVRVC